MPSFSAVHIFCRVLLLSVNFAILVRIEAIFHGLAVLNLAGKG